MTVTHTHTPIANYYISLYNLSMAHYWIYLNIWIIIIFTFSKHYALRFPGWCRAGRHTHAWIIICLQSLAACWQVCVQVWGGGGAGGGELSQVHRGGEEGPGRGHQRHLKYKQVPQPTHSLHHKEVPIRNGDQSTISGTDLIQPSTKNFKNVKLKLFVIYSLSIILDKSDFHYLISVCGMILSRVKMISKNKYTLPSKWTLGKYNLKSRWR